MTGRPPVKTRTPIRQGKLCFVVSVFYFVPALFVRVFFFPVKTHFKNFNMKKSTLYALTIVIAAIFSTLVVLKNFGTLYALPLLVVSFICLSFYVSVCNFNEQKQK